MNSSAKGWWNKVFSSLVFSRMLNLRFRHANAGPDRQSVNDSEFASGGRRNLWELMDQYLQPAQAWETEIACDDRDEWIQQKQSVQQGALSHWSSVWTNSANKARTRKWGSEPGYSVVLGLNRAITPKLEFTGWILNIFSWSPNNPWNELQERDPILLSWPTTRSGNPNILSSIWVAPFIHLPTRFTNIRYVSAKPWHRHSGIKNLQYLMR
jgi:hypothetical protein